MGTWSPEVDAGELDTENSEVSLVTVGGDYLLWLRSHQGNSRQPNDFMVDGNEGADAHAGRAARDALMRSPAGVRYPAGGFRFFMDHGGKMVTSEVGSYARSKGSDAAAASWACRSKRGMQGAAARELCGMAPASVPILEVAN